MSSPEQSGPSTKQWLEALSLADNGDWTEAHELVQAGNDPAAFWIHANLHREEGDHGNAGYWYQRAGQDPREGDLREERDEIRKSLQD
ncbi:hypothetical protein [Puniceicoccus vermicola]|uniref:Sel1 repeat family protein n=1 Tax=Puniceicoccus vermicola TaxID=388746 RepID=A0A7X1AUU8_9BACT|nr:hypothetical protein [Puniceicoccus vermicola]MBC2600431.1 hypothetical protein [Puniceicoccus vermicola]